MGEPRLAEYQFTSEEAIAFAKGGAWHDLTPSERGLLQLRQTCLCMDFSIVHEGTEALLNRPVYTHEFAKPDLLWEEYLGGKPIDFDAMMAKLPAHFSRVIIVTGGDSDG